MQISQQPGDRAKLVDLKGKIKMTKIQETIFEIKT